MRLAHSRQKLAVSLALLVLGLAVPALAIAQQRFADQVGNVSVQPVKGGATLSVPYILWGGDVATFWANGGLKTVKGSTFADLGLDLQLVAGDDFIEQVRRYLRGETPFLRGTMRMIGLASEVIGKDPRTKGVVFLQLTWSAGDHMVGREGFKTLNDVRGKKICLQRGGPHVGMLDDILGAAKLGWKDVEIVWVDDITGDKGPAERFRKDPSIDACMVITPDMIGVCGGLDSKGSGAEGTVNGAHVVISTANMSRSIADVYVCRKDYFDANRNLVEKFVAGYLKGCTDVLALKRDYKVNGKRSKYMDVLRMTQQIYGAEVIPTLEVDADGLIADCSYVGVAGNNSFFNDAGNLEGFQGKQKKALQLAVGQGYAGIEQGFYGPGFDYGQIARLGKLTYDPTKSGSGVAETTTEFLEGELDDKTILSFTISFNPDQFDFSALVYGQEFQRAVEQANLFGNAVVAIRGHADPTLTLVNFVKAGLQKGILKRTGSRGNWRYFYQNRPLDITDTAAIVQLIESGAFDGTEHDPRVTMQAARNLSRRRAEQVRDAIIAYAKSKGFNLDKNQIQPLGVGISEPVLAKPRNAQEAAENRRVEFRLVKVQAEATDDFDF